MAVRSLNMKYLVVISDDEEPDEMIIYFESFASENEVHEKPDEKNFGSQSGPSWQQSGEA